MKITSKQMRLSATDLSNHLACKHLTQLDLQVARGERSAPTWAAPDLKVIQELGKRHEAAYLKHLEEEKGLKVLKLPEHGNEDEIVRETLRLMSEGADVIAQGALQDGQWFGRPDALMRVEKPSEPWKWSYEVQDTKLARETKAGTILQLSLYSDLLARMQGITPEFFWVVTPGVGFTPEQHRVSDYAAYYRHVRDQLLKAAGKESREEIYPEPVEHCNVCRWFKKCRERRVADDHLSLVAGMRKQQQQQLEEWKAETMAKLAALPIPLKERPKRGSREAIDGLGKQARVQVKGRNEANLVHEPILPVEKGMGFSRLPEPNHLDMFVDLEGDPFAGTRGQQYLFGFVVRDSSGEMVYEKQWTLTAEEEKRGFEWLMDEIVHRWTEEPGMHVYHYGANEPSARHARNRARSWTSDGLPCGRMEPWSCAWRARAATDPWDSIRYFSSAPGVPALPGSPGLPTLARRFSS